MPGSRRQHPCGLGAPRPLPAKHRPRGSNRPARCGASSSFLLLVYTTSHFAFDCGERRTRLLANEPCRGGDPPFSSVTRSSAELRPDREYSRTFFMASRFLVSVSAVASKRKDSPYASELETRRNLYEQLGCGVGKKRVTPPALPGRMQRGSRKMSLSYVSALLRKKPEMNKTGGESEISALHGGC